MLRGLRVLKRCPVSCASAAAALLLAVACAQSESIPNGSGGSASALGGTGGMSNESGTSGTGGSVGGFGATGGSPSSGGSNGGSGAGGTSGSGGTGGSGATGGSGGSGATGGTGGSGATGGTGGSSATGGTGGTSGSGGTGGGAAKLVINEVDYNEPSIDKTEFVEIYNAGSAAADLTNIALVLINGANNTEYGRVPFSGTLAAGGYLVVADPAVTVASGAQKLSFGSATQDNVQNGSPDGLALFNTQTNTLIDALSYGGSITQATINGAPGTYNLVQGTATSAVDSSTSTGSLARLPNGTDTNDAANDWAFTSTPTPGSANQ